MPGTDTPRDQGASSTTHRLKLPDHSLSSQHPASLDQPELGTERHGAADMNPAAPKFELPREVIAGGPSGYTSRAKISTQKSPHSPTGPDETMARTARASIGGDGETAEDETILPTAEGAVPNINPSSSQLQLNEYRERLARDLEKRELSARGMVLNQADKSRISPIQEEDNSNVPLPTTTLTSTSTESGNTVRGAFTPAPVAGTPSYPFPRMAGSNLAASGFHKSYPSPPNFRNQKLPSGIWYDVSGVHDQVLSGNTTPASTLTFFPHDASPPPENFDFPTPNLYDLSLMLSAEPGLDAWWTTVVQIMKDVYKAERVTLAVPADPTDLENVPWGQKATYNEHVEDDLSLGYMARGSSAVLSSGGPALSETPILGEESPNAGATMYKRPGLSARHSFTSYEEKKEHGQLKGSSSEARPAGPIRSASYLPTNQSSKDAKGYSQLDRTALKEHNAVVAEEPNSLPSWEAPFAPQGRGRGRVLSVLQALDYEADPLIDHSGVMRVLERGKGVALTRTYPYLAPDVSTEQGGATQAPPSKPGSSDSNKKSKRQRSDSSKFSSFFNSNHSRSSGRGRDHGLLGDKAKVTSSRFEEEVPRPPTPNYEEFEQAPPSPWSQSPAPSPAVRTDTKENPFFTDAMVDEDSFNPGPESADYSGMRPIEAIGVDDSWTVLHIPLTHVLLSRPTPTFKLDKSAIPQRSGLKREASETQGDKDTSGADQNAEEPSRKAAPIAILSILSPIIPYPSNLRHSLEHLAPHMATSFSLCRQYSNIETELAGIQRRRPSTTGFGAVGPDGRPLEAPPYPSVEEIAGRHSLHGSMTSPSDYSAVSKSMTGSPAGTPGWEQGSLGLVMDKRQPLPSPGLHTQSSESYFSSKQRSSWNSGGASKSGSKDNSPGEKRHSRYPSKVLRDVPDDVEPTYDLSYQRTGTDSTPLKSPPPLEGPEKTIETLRYVLQDKSADPVVQSPKPDQSGRRHGHTKLHSYGADFSSTFQSLPPSSSVTARPGPVPNPSRPSSYVSLAADMPPPSDRLKGLILDSLPAHVFVALPQTGEIVWVNSRYLAYRGQTVADLTVDPWGSIHQDDRDEYLKAWGHSLRTGEQFSRTVRIKRFDGAFRWFHARAVASKDKRGVIMQFLGSYMDIHDQHIAELKAARQEEIEASEAKHRLLANLIPQIIFTATGEDGITFANEQWLSYTGQSFEDSLGLGFMNYVHPDDLARCQIPPTRPSGSSPPKESARSASKVDQDFASPATASSSALNTPKVTLEGLQVRERQPLSRNESSTSSSSNESPPAELVELARKGVIKLGTDSNGRPSYTTEVRLRSKTGEYRWHLIRCVEIDTIDFGSGASSYFGSATDINDHKLLEVKLKEAMETKGRFLSNMSHEIRTPLIGISGMVSFLQDTTLNEEQRDYTNTIQTSANSLIMIINDILDLSKVDAGMMKLKYEWFHTRSLIEDVNELVSTMAIAKRLELNYLVEADVPSWVKGDKVRIRQVLLNVIGNAIKFTTEGEVFSRCKVCLERPSGIDDSEVMLEFAITDTGRGFSDEEAELMFKPFSQIDGSSTRQHGGSGLGLVISRQLVELHGGKMVGTAVLGKGSTFTFTARFALPSTEDHPDLPGSPNSTMYMAASRHGSSESVPGSVRPLPPPKHVKHVEDVVQSANEADYSSPGVLSSTSSSNPSVHSGRSHITDRSSATSVNNGLARFSEAAKASGQDLSQMQLEMPSGRSSPGRTATPDNPGQPSPDDFRPPMYSILIICPQVHSREATTQHIKMTLPTDVPQQITALATVEEAQQFIGGDDPVNFTHVVINLPSAEAIIRLMNQLATLKKLKQTTVLILSDSVQRQAVAKLAADDSLGHHLSENQVTFIYKPVKPSRFAVIFDPDKVQDLSTDRNRSTAQRMLEDQKASYQEIQKRMGNMGYKVLLVEDNPVNQKVLMKYLKKIGVEVEVAVDGVECTDMVLSKSHKYYSLILCDLHMPRKDGYQACREIRHWEKSANFPAMPIIALSANVMSDVQDKCLAAGFSDYVAKPVDFIDLSRAMAKFF